MKTEGTYCMGEVSKTSLYCNLMKKWKQQKINCIFVLTAIGKPVQGS